MRTQHQSCSICNTLFFIMGTYSGALIVTGLMALGVFQ